MSIENRLAAKKRSEKARRRAKTKSAIELALIVLIPVAVLLIVFFVMNHIKSQIKDYSKGFAEDGSIEGYSVKDHVVLPDLDTMTINYDTFKPTDDEVENRIYNDLREAVPAEEAPTDEDATALREAYLALLTDENTEKWFAEKLGTDYEHTANGFRTYISETLHKNNYDSDAETKILEYLEDVASVSDLPEKHVKNWIQIVDLEMREDFEQQWKDIFQVEEVYELYGGEENYESLCKEEGEKRVRQQAEILAAFDQLGLSYTDEELDSFIEERAEKAGISRKEYIKTYGENYQAWLLKRQKVVDALKAKITVPEEKSGQAEE